MTQITFDTVRNRLASIEPKQVPITPPMRQAAVSVVLAANPNSGMDLLLIKRAEHAEDPWSGQMALPGGRRDDDDRDLLGTALRETDEETGIRLNPRFLLGGLDDLGPASPRLPRIVVRPFVFGLAERPEVTLNRESTLHVWTPLDTLGDKRATEPVRGRYRELTAPGFRIGAHFVWGMTERILSGFLEAIRAR